MLGQAAQSFEVTLDYLKTRVQFGQVIGSFQALQASRRKMFTDLELARSCVEAALAGIGPRSRRYCPARLACQSQGRRPRPSGLERDGAAATRHRHTDVHDAGLYLKRARIQEATFGKSLLSSRSLTPPCSLLRGRSMPPRLLPEPTPETKEFWTAAAKASCACKMRRLRW